ncbi:MAG TPA: hypothetical protein VGB37_15745 [Candidatus Lokiarchaeia archaeon]
MKNTVAKKIFDSFLSVNGSSFKINFQAVTHPNKNNALRSVWSNLERTFNRFKQSYNKLKYLESLPHIGPITKFHLARNLGLDYAKPDRHLVKIALAFGYSNVQAFCREASELTGDKIGLVDLVFWRFAVLNTNNYLELIEIYKRFALKIYGLSEDMEDFILEQNDYYSNSKTKFWSSFWEVCSEMWSNDVDLSNKQLDIIYKEYNKVKDIREKEALKNR